MASVSTDSKGNRRILFFDAAGERKTIRLGKTPKRQADSIKGFVEELVSSQRSGISPNAETAAWVRKIGSDLASKLAAVGLIPRRGESQAVRLGEFIDGIIGSHTSLKPGTLTNYQQTRRWLVNYFGLDKPLNAVTPGDLMNCGTTSRNGWGRTRCGGT